MKNTKIILGIIGLLIISILVFLSLKSKNNIPILDNSSVLNIAYNVDGNTYNLVNGKAELAIENSSAKNTLSIFGEPVYGDLDKDGDDDAAILLVYNTGGSGTFYYASLVINNDGKYLATNTMLLGDRIAPQTVEIQDGHALYNIMQRNITDPMTTPPSIGKSIWIYYNTQDNTIGEWVKDFEGEIDDQTMVNKYITDNIKTLSPIQPILGGSWYAYGVSVNPVNKTGAVVYEDGHIQGIAIFKYITNRNGVTIEKFNLIDTTEKYIHPLKWAPIVKVADKPYVCNVGGSQTQSSGQTSLIKINNNEYCAHTLVQGAAGSTYTEYTYSRPLGNKTETLNFTIQAVQCMNYDEPSRSTCKDKQSNYDLLPVVDVLFNSL